MFSAPIATSVGGTAAECDTIPVSCAAISPPPKPSPFKRGQREGVPHTEHLALAGPTLTRRDRQMSASATAKRVFWFDDHKTPNVADELAKEADLTVYRLSFDSAEEQN